jgi:homocitrate synthase NifV
MPEIKIVDTTLRDGEQTAGVVFSNQEKIEIAKFLDKAGVYQIEAGVPTMGGDEKQAIKDIVNLGLRASILGWNRAVAEDINHSLDCGLDAVCVSISVSDIHIERKLRKDRAWVLDNIERAINYAKSHGLYVSCNAEDASRADMEFLLKFTRVAKDAGANRMRFCDTIGILEPFRTYEKVKLLIDEVGLPIEIHTHNDFGMATANTLAALKAGAQFASVTVNGLGERAGNAALEEVVMALKHTEQIDVGFNVLLLRELSSFVAQASGREISVSKPIIGRNIFFHEAGVQADGVIKEPSTYEAFSPKEVGGERQILIGKHSGTASIKGKFEEFGMSITDDQAKIILEQVRSKSVETKRPLFDKELMQIYYKLGLE